MTGTWQASVARLFSEKDTCVPCSSHAGPVGSLGGLGLQLHHHPQKEEEPDDMDPGWLSVAPLELPTHDFSDSAE